jgi:hypothetical protein
MFVAIATKPAPAWRFPMEAMMSVELEIAAAFHQIGQAMFVAIIAPMVISLWVMVRCAR